MSLGSHGFAANLAARPGRSIEVLLAVPHIADLLAATHVDWETGTLSAAPAAIREALVEVDGLSRDSNLLTASGIRLLGKVQVDLVAAISTPPVPSRFEICETLAKGGNSVTFRATNRAVGRSVVLKLLRPRPADQLEKAIRQLGALENIPHLVAPIDSFPLTTRTVSDDPVTLHCIVFPYIPAKTLHEYLRAGPPITPYFFEAFLRQIGGVLAGLEEQRTKHGDLHAGNILVSDNPALLSFTVIDPSPGLATATPYGQPTDDLEWFREHLSWALTILQRHLPSISVQKHLGARLYFLLVRVLHKDPLAFKDLLKLLDSDPQYDAWLMARANFVGQKFADPKPLGLLRWEEIADPAQAVQLFEPYPELFKRISTFGNSLMVGARGSGKSTYLAALAYFPGATTRLVEPGDVFGVLFSCRQGEFKQMSQAFMSFDAVGQTNVKHVLVLKIIRRILSTLAGACQNGELHATGELSGIYAFIERYIAGIAQTARPGGYGAAALSDLAAGVVRWEELAIGALFSPLPPSGPHFSHRLDEGSLIEFCNVVRKHFSTLHSTTFFLLFDDAGEPNVPREMQHVLNDLVTSSNSVFCIKLSAERFSYDLKDSAGRTLEETHDLTSFDIASLYSPERGGSDTSREQLKQYFARIMQRRLEHWHYPSTNIAAYLGDQALPSAGSSIPVRELIRRLAMGRKNAYYSGWDVVWQLADSTARTLIELVSEIFARASVRPAANVTSGLAVPPTVIPARLQDKAIRVVSNRRLRGLEYIPGELTLSGNKVPLGKHLFLCATSFGTTSRRYLLASGGDSTHRNVSASGERRRFDERLAIERNDTMELSEGSEKVLHSLVRYDIFDDSALNVAFDDGQKKPIFVFNRIFCPAFGMSFRRDAHLRLSAGKLEMFLLDPATFVKTGTKFLQQGTDEDNDLGLFDSHGK